MESTEGVGFVFCFTRISTSAGCAEKYKYREGLKSLVLLPCRDVLDSLGESKSCRFLNHQDTLYPVSFPLRSYVFKNGKENFFGLIRNIFCELILLRGIRQRLQFFHIKVM